jgi:hypothetical protein
MGAENPSEPRPDDIPEDGRTGDEPDPSGTPPKTPQKRSSPGIAAANARPSGRESSYFRAFK